MLLIFWSELQSEAECLKHCVVISFFQQEKLINFSGEDFNRILLKIFSEIRWQQNSCGILREFWSEYWWKTSVPNTPNDFEILWEFRSEFLMKCTQPNRWWLQNSLKNLIRMWQIQQITLYLIRILVEDAANPSDNYGINLEFWWEFQLILNNVKSADCVWFQSKIYVGN